MYSRRQFIKYIGLVGVALSAGQLDLFAQLNVIPSTRSQISNIGMAQWVNYFSRLIDAERNATLNNSRVAQNERERVAEVMADGGFTVRSGPVFERGSVEFYAYENRNRRNLDYCNVYFPDYNPGRKPVFESASIIGTTLMMRHINNNEPELASAAELAKMFLPTGYINNPEPEDLWSNNHGTFGEYYTRNGTLATEYSPRGSGGTFVVEVNGDVNLRYSHRVT